MEAGGHIGPVSTTVLAQEILPESPSRCRSSSRAASAGARRSRAISKWARRASSSARASSARPRCIAHPNFKKAFIRASARDAVASVQIDPRLPVIPVRALKNAGDRGFTAKQREVAQLLDDGKVDMGEAQLQIEHYWAGALRRAVIDGDVEHGSLMAGQSVGMVTSEEPVAEIIATLMAEAARGAGAAGGLRWRPSAPVFRSGRSWMRLRGKYGLPGSRELQRVWLKLAKAGAGMATVSKAEAIDGALCHGWIDGQLNPFDDDYWLIRFTPRKGRSKWSERNRVRAIELIADGRVSAAGRPRSRRRRPMAVGTRPMRPKHRSDAG